MRARTASTAQWGSHSVILGAGLLAARQSPVTPPPRPRSPPPSAPLFRVFFFFNDTATTEISTLSLHDALPIWARAAAPPGTRAGRRARPLRRRSRSEEHTSELQSRGLISYAVFCLKTNTQ